MLEKTGIKSTVCGPGNAAPPAPGGLAGSGPDPGVGLGTAGVGAGWKWSRESSCACAAVVAPSWWWHPRLAAGIGASCCLATKVGSQVGTFWGPFQLMLGPLAWGIKGYVFSGSVCCSSGIFILVSTLGFQVSGVLPLGLHPMQEAELKAVAALSCSPGGDAAVEPRPCRVGLAVKSSTR